MDNAVMSRREQARIDVGPLTLAAQLEDDTVDQRIAEALEEAQDWPEVRVPLLNVAVIREMVLQRDVTAALDRLEAAAAAEGMNAMRALALLQRIQQWEEVGLGSTSFEELAEARVLLDDETQPVRDRCSGFIELASLCDRLHLSEHADVALDDALRVLQETERGAEGRAVLLSNRAISACRWALDAVEVGALELADEAIERCDRFMAATEWSWLPPAWRAEVELRRSIAVATRHDRFVTTTFRAEDMGASDVDELRTLHQLVSPPDTWEGEPDLDAVDPSMRSVARFLLARARRHQFEENAALEAMAAYARSLAEDAWDLRSTASAALRTRIEARRMRDEHAELRRQSLTDALTGTHNRRSFELATARLEGKPATLLTIDLDRFKRVNDTYGHHIGDLVLRRVADAIVLAVNTIEGDVLLEPGSTVIDVDGPIVARIGGDEFSVFFGGDDMDRARRLVERIEATIAAQEWSSLIGDWSQDVTVGFATGLCGDELIRSADRVLYDRKPRHARHELGAGAEAPL